MDTDDDSGDRLRKVGLGLLPFSGQEQKQRYLLIVEELGEEQEEDVDDDSGDKLPESSSKKLIMQVPVAVEILTPFHQFDANFSDAPCLENNFKSDEG